MHIERAMPQITNHCNACGAETPDSNNLCHPSAIVDSIVSAVTPSMTPLADALAAAISAAALAEQDWLDDDTSDDDACVGSHGDDCQHPTLLASRAADTAVDVARAALVASDEPREWDLSEEGLYYETVSAPSLTDALKIAADNVSESNYDHPDGTLWIDVSVVCAVTGEGDRDTVALDPPEPTCTRHGRPGEEHDWQSPVELVGGIRKNPGVWGHGGGAKIHTVCSHCGAHRHVDTWAQRRDTGEQGLTSVSYSDPDEASLVWVASLREDETVDA